MLGVALGLASLAGINLYLTVFVTGLAVHMNWVVLPPALHDLGVLGDPVIIGVAGFLYLIEFFADKVPWIDTAWDSVHTFIRPVGAAALAVATLGDCHPVFEVVAALLAGGMALTTHVAKAGTRLVANGSPEPVSNIGLSLAEDGIVLGGLGLILWNPIVALVVALLASGLILSLLPRLWRGIRAKLWLAWRKLNTPTESNMETEPGCRLPSASETLLRRSHASTSAIRFAIPCLSGGGPRLLPNVAGHLVCLENEPEHLFFVARHWGTGTMLHLDIAGADIEHLPGFLGDRLEITHRDGSPRHSFVFERGLTKAAARFASGIKQPASDTSRIEEPETHASAEPDGHGAADAC